MAPTAIVIPVLEARPAADRWRRAYTEGGADGMPPHVTLLYPFVDDESLTERHVRGLAGVAAGRPAFDFALARLGEFPAGAGQATVLYLAPEPSEPFAALTEALVRAFPEHPPYGGAFAEVVPHLTLAWHPDAPLREIRADVERALPIAVRAREAWLMRLGRRGWTAHRRAPLGPGA
jgi:2'-5' RNA ligase